MLTLHDHPLLLKLDPEEQTRLEEKGSHYHYAPRTIILHEGQIGDCVYLVLEGSLKVYVTSTEGSEVILTLLKAGDQFGELALLSGSERTASVMSVTAATLFAVPGDFLRGILSRYPHLLKDLTDQLTRRIHELTENVRSLALEDVYGRLARNLRALAVERDNELHIDEPITQQELANRVGASREMVARILKDLRAGGYLRMEGRHMVIMRPLPKRY
jgi:CRP/FNR family cyclic AMP-dependent transcriptional regulator